MFWKRSRIYMDAAAATPLSPEVYTRFIEALTQYGNPGALHTEGVRAKELLEGARKEAAVALHAHADEIVFTGSGTESNNLAIFGAVGDVSADKIHIITSSIEHPSVLEPIRAFERRGAKVTYLPVDAEGLIALSALKEAIVDETRLISVGLINSEIGTIQDVRGIAKIIRDVRKTRVNAAPLLLHLDAAQAPLWLKLNVEQLHPDLLTLDAQKMMGPKGAGLLYVRRGVSLQAHLLGGGQERGLRSGTENAAAASALARALTRAQEVCEKNTANVAEVRDALFDAIKKQIPEAIVNGSLESRVANNCNVSVPGLIGERAVLALSAWGVAASTRSACAAKDQELSHVIRALEAGEGGVARARSAVRFTLLPDATVSDARHAATLLAKAAAQFRNIDA